MLLLQNNRNLISTDVWLLKEGLALNISEEMILVVLQQEQLLLETRALQLRYELIGLYWKRDGWTPSKVKNSNFDSVELFLKTCKPKQMICLQSPTEFLA